MEELNNFKQKWGEETPRYGWVSIPIVLFFYQKALEITPIEMNVLNNLLLHWWESSKDPYPSQGAIARRIGISTRTVQRALDSLEEKQLIIKKRSSIHNPVYKGRNIYSLEPLVKTLNKISSQNPSLKSYLIDKSEEKKLKSSSNEK